MSLFKKPKKSIAQRRIFSSEENFSQNVEKMDIEDDDYKDSKEPVKEKKKDKKESSKDKSLVKPQKTSLLSFVDEEDEGETFQVKKSSYSRKIYKERKKEKKESRSIEKPMQKNNSNNSQNSNNNSQRDINTSSSTKESKNYVKEIQSESEGFSIRLKNSNPESLILNGRAALCAGRDEMSSEDEVVEVEKDRYGSSHKFSQPDDIRLKLESGAIPDAYMIHEARKRRQKAREEGEFISIEDNQEEIRKGKRNVREEDADGSSGEERVDMSAITGVKEREERREQFYSVQSDGNEHDDSDMEMNEWENQQIRKGVTGAQLMTAHQDSTFSQYLIPPIANSKAAITEKKTLTTAELLQQAYSQTNYEMAKQLKKEKKKEVSKSSGIKTPQEILKIISDKLRTSRELNHKHYLEIDKITEEFSSIKVDLEESEKNGPQAALKYRFYQELKLYTDDLIECLNEKVPQIAALEEKTLAVMSKYSKMLIERRRQDVRDQAKEITDTKSVKKTQEDEERVRRAAEREGRRTRRRRDREKLSYMNEAHNDGMSSDDEVPDIELNQYKEQLSQIKEESTQLFEDVTEEYCELPMILQKFEEWKKKDASSYNEAFAHLCLPKIVGVFMRWEMILWTPFSTETYEDIEKMKWYHSAAMYGKSENETEATLRNDPDVFLVPTVVEKVVLPKLNRIIEGCYDPLSNTQTLKLVKLLNQLSHEYPSLRITSKNLQTLFMTITEKMKLALDNDVFIPIFTKQTSDSKSSVFFQRQFFSGIKLFRNFTSFQGIIADPILKNFAISCLLNRYLLSAMRISSAVEGVSKALTLVNSLSRTWLVTADKNFIDSMNLFVIYVGNLESQLDPKSPTYADSVEKLKQIMTRLELMVKT